MRRYLFAAALLLAVSGCGNDGPAGVVTNPPNTTPASLDCDWDNAR